MNETPTRTTLLDTLTGIAVAVAVAALLAPLLLSLAFLCWGLAGRAYQFMCGGF
jgi:hypothetical protein